MISPKNIKTQWDLSLIYKDEQDPKVLKQKQNFTKKCDAFIQKWKNKDDYLIDPLALKQILEEKEDIDESPESDYQEAYYYSLKSSLNQDDTEIIAKLNKIHDFLIKYVNELQFVEIKLSKIPEDTQKAFLTSPFLTKYHKDLKKLFENAKHILSEDSEKILNLMGKTSYSNWVEMTSQFLDREEGVVKDKTGKKEKLLLSELFHKIKDQDKTLRDSAAKEINRIMEKHADTAEHELNAVLEYKKINDDLRKFNRPDEQRLTGDEIDTQIVDTLTEAVTKRADISKNYYKLKAQLLGQKKLKYHERVVELGSINLNFTYDEAVDLVYKTLNKLDLEFSEIFKNFVENGHIDVFPAKRKTGGAFCTYNGKNSPIYILLNFVGKIDDLTTIAHETGHGIHNQLSQTRQPSMYREPSLFTAEIASTFMENFALEETVKNIDDESRLWLLMRRLDDNIATIIIQIHCYTFETELHSTFREKGYLSKKCIGEIFTKHMAKYMGDYVEQSAGSENWWVYWGHIRSYFYVYSYASGLLVSKALQKMVKENPQDIQKVKKILSAGSSLTPKDMFAEVGIDITSIDFWDTGLDEIENMLYEAESLAKKLGKI